MPEPYSAEKNFSQEFAELLGQAFEQKHSATYSPNACPKPIGNNICLRRNILLTSLIEGLGATPFELLYGRAPSNEFSNSGDRRVEFRDQHTLVTTTVGRNLTQDLWLKNAGGKCSFIENLEN